MSVQDLFVIILITGICVGIGVLLYMAVTDWIPNYQSNQVNTTPEGLGSSYSSYKTCPACGGQVAAGATTCPHCGAPIEGASQLRCPKCGSSDIGLHTQVEEKKTGCMTILLYIILACTILGIFILIPMIMRNQQQTVTYAVCHNCGYNWVTSKR